jgi:hypothetical protein
MKKTSRSQPCLAFSASSSSSNAVRPSSEWGTGLGEIVSKLERAVAKQKLSR